MQKTPQSCSTASDYQIIAAQTITIMTFMFESTHYQSSHAQTATEFMLESTLLLDHPSPSHKNVCVTRASKYHKHCAQWTKSMSFPGTLMQKHHAYWDQASHIQLLIPRTQKKPDYQRCASFATRFSTCKTQCC